MCTHTHTPLVCKSPCEPSCKQSPRANHPRRANPRANHPHSCESSCKAPPSCNPSCKAPRDPGELLVHAALVQPQPTVTSILVQTLVHTTPSCNPACKSLTAVQILVQTTPVVQPRVQSARSRAKPRAKHHTPIVRSVVQSKPSCKPPPSCKAEFKSLTAVQILVQTTPVVQSRAQSTPQSCKAPAVVQSRVRSTTPPL